MDTMSCASRTVTHPLDPLIPAEIETAVAIVRRERALGDDVLFVSIALHEPPKDVVLAFREGEAIERCAFLVLRDRKARATCEVVVSLAPAPSSPGARCRACMRTTTARGRLGTP